MSFVESFLLECSAQIALADLNAIKRWVKVLSQEIALWLAVFSFSGTNQQNNIYYYMAKPVLGKSLCSDWFFLGQDFAVRTISMETV